MATSILLVDIGDKIEILVPGFNISWTPTFRNSDTYES